MTKPKMADGTKSNPIDRFTVGVLLSLTMVCVVAVILEFARWIYEWLRFGQSVNVSLTSLIGEPRVSWVGVQSVISFIWNADVAFVALPLMFVSGWACVQLIDDMGRKK